MARNLRQQLTDRLACYENALTLAEQDIRRGVASVDHFSAVFMVGDDLCKVVERHRLLTALVMELRDLARCAGDDPTAKG
jgi:hypothetical protein